MHKQNIITRVFLMAFIMAVAVAAPLKLMAQDEGSEPTFIPPTDTSVAPPVIIDESDSSSVSDTEEYDG